MKVRLEINLTSDKPAEELADLLDWYVADMPLDEPPKATAIVNYKCEEVGRVTILPDDGEKTDQAQCFEIAQNAAAMVLGMEAHVDEAIEKLEWMIGQAGNGCSCNACVTKREPVLALGREVMERLGRMKAICNGAEHTRCPNCGSDSTAGIEKEDSEFEMGCFACGCGFNLPDQEGGE